MAENLDIQKFNTDVRRWSYDTRNMLTQQVQLLTNSEKAEFIRTRSWQPLAANINPRTIVTYGVPERVIFSYPAHGYYISVGSGRGHNKNTNPRKIVDWYNQVLDKQLEVLADVVANHLDDMAIRVSKI